MRREDFPIQSSNRVHGNSRTCPSDCTLLPPHHRPSAARIEAGFAARDRIDHRRSNDPDVFRLSFGPEFLDVRFSRRSYAILFGILTALAAFLALRSIAAPMTLAVYLVAGFLCANMFYNALGGWLGDLAPRRG